MKQDYNLAVVIPLRNTREYNRPVKRLDDVLYSLSRQSIQKSVQVIVSDIDSDKEFRQQHEEICKKYNVEYVYTKTGQKWNISRARNIGIRHSTAKYVMVTDVDIVFSRNFMEIALKFTDKNSIIHCRLSDLPRNYQERLDNFEMMTRDRLELRPPTCYGGCQIVSRDWVFKVHGYDEEYETWGADDTDFRHRAVSDGLREIWIEHETSYFHQYHSKDNRQDNRLQLGINRMRCKLSENNELPIIRNTFGWGGVATKSEHPDTAIVITTFLRDENLFACVKSIRKYYPGIAIYVADCGEYSDIRSTDKKDKILKDNNCVHIKLPFDTGVCGSRNAALKKIPKKYNYILICEDDILFMPESRIDVWREILNHDKTLGLVGGVMWKAQPGREAIQHYEGDLEIDGALVKILERKPEWISIKNNIKYCYYDIILNVFLMRREVHDDIKWDDKIPQAPEHLDFFLSLKRFSSWKVGYTDGFQMKHVQYGYTGSYKAYRQRNQGFRHFAKKHGIRNVYSDWHKQFNTYPDTVDYLTWEMKPHSALIQNLIDVKKILNAYNEDWFLANGTCLGVVRSQEFVRDTDNIDIGLLPNSNRKWAEIVKDLKTANFSVEKQDNGLLIVSRDKIFVKLYFLMSTKDFFWHSVLSPTGELIPYAFSKELLNETMEFKFNGLPVRVPKNVKEYLSAIYGETWKIPNGTYKSWEDSGAIDYGFLKDDRKALIPGVWEILHVGHLSLFEQAKNLGAEVIVGIMTDDAIKTHRNASVVPFTQRKKIIESLSVVDKIVFLNGYDIAKEVKRLRLHPDYIILKNDDSLFDIDKEFHRKRKCKIVTISTEENNVFSKIQRNLNVSTKDKHYSGDERIAIGIKTFLREELLYKTLDSIDRHMPFPYRLYIADDSGKISDKRRMLYQELKEEGHVIIELPYNVGLSSGRNAIVKRVKERFVLMTDDDIMLDDKETVEKMLDVLTSEDNLGLVSGLIHLENGQYLAGEIYQKGLRFEIKDKVLYRHPSIKEYHKTKNGTIYIIADQVVNFFLAKKELFNDVMWDERIKIEWEHQDFFYQLLKTTWKSAVCLGTRAVHQTHIPDNEYNGHRRNSPAVYFMQKHGIVASLNKF